MMGRRVGISERPYGSIVKALDKIADKLVGIGIDMDYIRSAINLQTQYLELITKKYNKKAFKRHFGKKKYKYGMKNFMD